MISRATVLGVVGALVLCSAARADVTLFSVVNNAEIAAVSPFSFGNVAQGDTKTVRFRMRNSSAAAATQVTVLGASGAGFALNGQPPIPFVLAPGAAQDFNVIFTAGGTASSTTSYSGNLQVNGISLTLLASASPAPALTVVPPCSGTSASAGAAFSGAVDFGQVPAGQLKVCDFQLVNQSAASETLSTFTVTGAGFQGPIGLTSPVTLAGQQSSNFSIDFMTAQPGIYSGTLTYASRTFQLTATVFAPTLPAPILSFDTTLVNSGEQHTLSMRLPSASSIDAAGNVSLTFLPDSPVVLDDPAILFVATGTRTLPFAVKAGSTQILIGGASGAVFQTGTSSGRIQFAVSGVAQGLTGSAATELRIPPSTITVDTATFTERLGNLDVQVTGFDNTYTAGVMAFTFYDGAGNAINPGTIQADFTSQFRAYFTTSTAGSMFLMGVTFPVSGSQVGFAAADVALTNQAGSATIRKLALQ
jgi:hypothetical protein